MLTLRKNYIFYLFRMTKIGIISLSALLSLTIFTSCHRTTLEDQAEKVAQEYTERNCPTPVQDMTITDSITFDRSTKTFNYYYTLTDKADDAAAIAKAKGKLTKNLIKSVKENTSMKVYKDAGYNFHYIYRSQKSGQTLYEHLVTKKDYK